MLVDLLDKCTVHLPCKTAHTASGGLLYNLQKPVEVLLDLLLACRIRHRGSRRSCALGVNKRKGIVVLHFSHNFDGLVHICRGLSRKSDDNICCKRYVRDLAPDFVCQIKILLLGITPVHGLQYSRRPRLQWQVQMAADLPGMLHHLDQVI